MLHPHHYSTDVLARVSKSDAPTLLFSLAAVLAGSLVWPFWVFIGPSVAIGLVAIVICSVAIALGRRALSSETGLTLGVTYIAAGITLLVEIERLFRIFINVGVVR